MKVIQMPSNHLPLPSGTIYILVFDLFLLKTNKEILTSEKIIRNMFVIQNWWVTKLCKIYSRKFKEVDKYLAYNFHIKRQKSLKNLKTKEKLVQKNCWKRKIANEIKSAFQKFCYFFLVVINTQTYIHDHFPSSNNADHLVLEKVMKKK